MRKCNGHRRDQEKAEYIGRHYFVIVIIILLQSWFPVHISRYYEKTKASVTDKVEQIRPVNACNIHEYKVWYSYRVGNTSYEDATGWIEGEVSNRMTEIDIRYDRNKPWKSVTEKTSEQYGTHNVFWHNPCTYVIGMGRG